MPEPVIVRLSDHPLDLYVVPCPCGHDYSEHQPGGMACQGLDSYDCPCECLSYEVDSNIYTDLTDDDQ